MIGIISCSQPWNNDAQLWKIDPFASLMGDLGDCNPKSNNMTIMLFQQQPKKRPFLLSKLSAREHLNSSTWRPACFILINILLAIRYYIQVLLDQRGGAVPSATIPTSLIPAPLDSETMGGFVWCDCLQHCRGTSRLPLFKLQDLSASCLHHCGTWPLSWLSSNSAWLKSIGCPPVRAAAGLLPCLPWSCVIYFSASCLPDCGTCLIYVFTTVELVWFMYSRLRDLSDSCIHDCGTCGTCLIHVFTTVELVWFMYSRLRDLSDSRIHDCGTCLIHVFKTAGLAWFTYSRLRDLPDSCIHDCRTCLIDVFTTAGLVWLMYSRLKD